MGGWLWVGLYGEGEERRVPPVWVCMVPDTTPTCRWVGGWVGGRRKRRRRFLCLGWVGLGWVEVGGWVGGRDLLPSISTRALRKEDLPIRIHLCPSQRKECRLAPV